MNIIPLTFDENLSAYNIVSGNTLQEESSENFFSVFILNRSGSMVSDTIFENVLSLNFKSVFAFLNNNKATDNIVSKYPSIKFIKTLEKVSVGEMINICASESNSKFFIVLWTDTIIIGQGFITSMLNQLLDEKTLCTVPNVFSSKMESLPNLTVPSFNENRIFKVQRLQNIKSETQTLYPLDYIGIYDRQKFIDIAGFDYTIKNNYWQLLDFSLRAWLYDYRICIAPSFRVQYIADAPVENTSADSDYRIFFLKNLAFALKQSENNTEAYIPNTMFLTYLKKSGQRFFAGLKTFKAAKSWVAVNSDRLKKTTLQLIEQWGTKA